MLLAAMMCVYVWLCVVVYCNRKMILQLGIAVSRELTKIEGGDILEWVYVSWYRHEGRAKGKEGSEKSHKAKDEQTRSYRRHMI